MSGFSAIAPSSGVGRAVGASEDTSVDALTVLHGKEIRERLSFPGDGAKWRPMLVAWQYGGNNELTIFYNFGGKKLDPAFFDLYRSLQAMQNGLGGNTTTFVGEPKGDFFRFFENSDGAAAQPQQ